MDGFGIRRSDKGWAWFSFLKRKAKVKEGTGVGADYMRISGYYLQRYYL